MAISWAHDTTSSNDKRHTHPAIIKGRGSTATDNTTVCNKKEIKIKGGACLAARSCSLIGYGNRYGFSYYLDTATHKDLVLSGECQRHLGHPQHEYRPTGSKHSCRRHLCRHVLGVDGKRPQYSTEQQLAPQSKGMSLGTPCRGATGTISMTSTTSRISTPRCYTLPLLCSLFQPFLLLFTAGHHVHVLWPQLVLG